MQKLFLQEYSYLPVTKRVNEIKKNLINTLKQNKGTVISDVERSYDIKIDEVRRTMKDCPERRQRIIKLAEKRDELMEKIKKE